MKKRFLLIMTMPLLIIAQGSAHACQIRVPLKIENVKYADIVVVGTISNYKIILDNEARKRNEEWIKKHPENSDFYKNINRFGTDYARFDIKISEIMKGKAPASLTVTWDNSTFGEPETMPPGPFLIALRHGPGTTILPNGEPELPTVLQAPCSDAFIFKSDSEEANAVRKILASQPK